MNGAFILLLLRMLSALILLGFLGRHGLVDLPGSATLLPSRRQKARAIQGHLRVLASDSTTAWEGTIFPLLPVTRIGRAEHNTIVLEDAFVSAEHALLTRREGQWWLEDLNSRNGTLLNDLAITEANCC